jgi:ribose 5-phosphate isomerase A
MTVPSDVADARRCAALEAAALVEDGMIVGLGTGDTAAHAIRALGDRARAGLRMTGVATSRASEALGRSLGLLVRAPDDVAAIDLTIDGADELDGELRLVKGGGGALTREKIVARASARVAIVADWHKRVARLGESRRLPVEILAFGARWTCASLARLGLDPRVREGFVTDSGGLIADCALAAGADLERLDAELARTTGVVEHGLFLVEATLALVGHPDRVERYLRSA